MRIELGGISTESFFVRKGREGRKEGQDRQSKRRTSFRSPPILALRFLMHSLRPLRPLRTMILVNGFHDAP
jgi:hypothetical protein